MKSMSKSDFEKGLMVGLSLKGLSVSGETKVIEKEVEKIVYQNRYIEYPVAVAHMGIVTTPSTVYGGEEFSPTAQGGITL